MAPFPGDLDEIDVRTLRETSRVVADRAAATHDIDRIEVVDELDVMGHSRIEEPPAVAFVNLTDGNHAEFDLSGEPLRAENAGGVESVCGVEEFGFASDSEVFGEERETSGAVAAHFAFRSVGVVVAHRAVDFGTVGQGHHSVGSDSEVAVAQPGDQAGLGREDAVAVVDEDEVVSGTLVFCKFGLHLSAVLSRQVGDLAVVPGLYGARSGLFVRRFILYKNSKTSKSFATFVKNIRPRVSESGYFVRQRCFLKV